MPDCAYCEQTFDDEAAYVAHLSAAHEGELSRIDRRRVEQAQSGGGRSRAVVYGAVGIGVVLVAAAVYATVLAGGSAGPPASQPLPDHGNATLLSGVQRFPDEGNAHVPQGTHVDYGTRPPTSGKHYPQPTPAGFYTRPQPAGNLVHSLEHGAVVIYYDPSALTPAANASLHAFVDAHGDRWASVIVVPNPSADPGSPYVLTAWRTMLGLDGYRPATVRAFLAEYLGRGPEHPVR